MKNQLYVGHLLYQIGHPLGTLKKIIKGNPRFKCRMGKVKSSLKLADDCLLIKQNERIKKLPYKKMSDTSIHEKMWEIRVKVKCDHKMYTFDFPSIKKATDFYEQIVYSKIKAHS